MDMANRHFLESRHTIQGHGFHSRLESSTEGFMRNDALVSSQE